MTRTLENMLLEVEGLRVGFPTTDEMLWAVDGVNLHLAAGERIAIVGESGSGKSVCAQALNRIVEHRGGIIDPTSRVVFDGVDLLTLTPKALNNLRGRRIGFVFQEHQSALNPVRRVGQQIVQALPESRATTRRGARERTLELLDRVGIRDPQRVADSYPHELSGGMRQRATIAIALAPEPNMLIADEPSTALDILTQRQIVSLLVDLNTSSDLAVILISHDLALVGDFASRIYVMYSGRFVETGNAADVLARPQHQYTRALLDTVPAGDERRDTPLRVITGTPPRLTQRPSGCAFHPRCRLNDGERCVALMPSLELVAARGQLAACHHPGARFENEAKREPAAWRPTTAVTGAGANGAPLLEVEHLRREFGGQRRFFSSSRAGVRAVDDVSFAIRRGEVFGLVGESGSGKSTVAQCVANLIRPTDGRVIFDGMNLAALSTRQMRPVRRRLQVVFQDPRASLDPLRRVESLLAEPLRIHGLWGSPGNDRRRLEELTELVGLSPDDLGTYPHELSGGQLQRIALARALVLSPDLVICDEITTQLDASVSAQIINLLATLHAELGLTYLVIAHDLSFIRYFCDRVAVLREGRIVEVGTVEDVFSSPQHEYTQRLVSGLPGMTTIPVASAALPRS